MSVFIESFVRAAAHDHLRRGRLHRRARQGRASCSATASRCATPAPCSRRVQRFPMADEVVNDWPDRYLAEGRRRARAARRGLRAHPRPQVRRARDRGRGATPTSGTSARWGSRKTRARLPTPRQPPSSTRPSSSSAPAARPATSSSSESAETQRFNRPSRHKYRRSALRTRRVGTNAAPHHTTRRPSRALASRIPS